MATGRRGALPTGLMAGESTRRGKFLFAVAMGQNSAQGAADCCTGPELESSLTMAAGHGGALLGRSRGKGEAGRRKFLLAVAVSQSRADGAAGRYTGQRTEPHHGRRPWRSSAREISR